MAGYSSSFSGKQVDASISSVKNSKCYGMLNGWCAVAYVDNASSWPQSLLLNVCTRWSDGTPSVALLALIVHANPYYCKCTQLHAMRVSSACVDMIRFVKENANNKVWIEIHVTQGDVGCTVSTIPNSDTGEFACTEEPIASDLTGATVLKTWDIACN